MTVTLSLLPIAAVLAPQIQRRQIELGRQSIQGDAVDVEEVLELFL